MIYISTDYVFGGSGETPWDPDCKVFAPQNWYGQTKLLGELAVSSLLENILLSERHGYLGHTAEIL